MRRRALAGAGRPDRAATTGIRAADQPGREAAATAVTTASSTATASAGHGRLSGSMTWPAAASRCGTYANHAAKPSPAPASDPDTPANTPLATVTRRMCRPVAPTEPSMPKARSLR